MMLSPSQLSPSHIAGGRMAGPIAGPSQFDLPLDALAMPVAVAPAPAPHARFVGIGTDRAHGIHVSEDGLLAANPASARWAGARCAVFAPVNAEDATGSGALSGGGAAMYYFEACMLDLPPEMDMPGGGGGGILRVGFASASASLALGTDDDSFGYGATGMKCSGTLRYDDTPRPGQPPNSAFAPYGTTFGMGDIVGALLDRVHHVISFSLNGVDLGVAFELPYALRREASLHPAITIKGCAVQLNLGGAPLRHKPPHARTFADAGLVDAAPDVVRGSVIGRSWNTTHTDTSAHLINYEAHALASKYVN